ncbi:MAG: hypothetical protein AAF726_11550 [Planctomycetota bacterium]
MSARVLVWVTASALAALAVLASSGSCVERSRAMRDVAGAVQRVETSTASPLVAIEESSAVSPRAGRGELPSTPAAATPDIEFDVVVRTSAGDERPGLDGRLTLRLRGRDEAGEPSARSVDVEVAGGRVRLASARFAGEPVSLEVTGGVMNERTFTPLRGDLTLPLEFDSAASVLLLQRKLVRLRVVDAATGQDLTGVQVADGSNVVVGQSFPGPDPDLLVEDATSPLEFEVEGWELFTPSIRVRAPGFAWSSLRLAASEAVEQRVALRPGVDLRVAVLDPGGFARRDDAFFTLTDFDVETGTYLHRVELADAVENGVVLEGLEPGVAFAAGAFVDRDARIGQAWRPIALERIELRAGERPFVQLDLAGGAVAAPRRVDVPLGVTGARGWPAASVTATLRPRPGAHPDCVARSVDLDVEESGTVEPVLLTDVPAGEYELVCRAYGFRADVTIGPGVALEIVRPEPAVIAIEVDRENGPARLDPKLDGRRLARVTVEGAPPGPIRIVTSKGRFEVTGEDDEDRLFYGATNARPGLNELTLDRAALAEIRLLVDGEPFPFSADGGSPSVSRVSGPGEVVQIGWSRLRNPDRILVTVSKPGSYRLDVPLPAGVTAVRPIDLDARHGSREKVVCEAIRN